MLMLQAFPRSGNNRCWLHPPPICEFRPHAGPRMASPPRPPRVLLGPANELNPPDSPKDLPRRGNKCETMRPLEERLTSAASRPDFRPRKGTCSVNKSTLDNDRSLITACLLLLTRLAISSRARDRWWRMSRCMLGLRSTTAPAPIVFPLRE